MEEQEELLQRELQEREELIKNITKNLPVIHTEKPLIQLSDQFIGTCENLTGDDEDTVEEPKKLLDYTNHEIPLDTRRQWYEGLSFDIQEEYMSKWLFYQYEFIFTIYITLSHMGYIVRSLRLLLSTSFHLV